MLKQSSMVLSHFQSDRAVRIRRVFAGVCLPCKHVIKINTKRLLGICRRREDELSITSFKVSGIYIGFIVILSIIKKLGIGAR